MTAVGAAAFLAAATLSAVRAPAAPATAPIAAAPATAPTTAPTTAPAGLPVANIGGVDLKPVPRKFAAINPAVLDAEVELAIREGADYLLSRFDKGELPAQRGADLEMRRFGLHALAVYTVLSAGLATGEPRFRPDDPDVALMIEKLKGYRLDANHMGPELPVTFARAFRAAALSIYNREADRATLKADVEWLMAAHYQGGYSEDDRIAKWQPPLPPPEPIPGPIVGQMPGGVTNVRGGGTPAGQQQPSPHIPAAKAPPGRNVERPRLQPPVTIRPPGTGGGGAPRGLRPGVSRGGGGGGGVRGMQPMRPQKPRVPYDRNPFATKIDPNSGRRVPNVATTGPRGAVRDGEPRGAIVDRTPRGAVVDPPRELPRPVGPNRVDLGETAPWDNFNSQLAVFGVWSGSEAGVSVPSSYWADVLSHWKACQLEDGQWPYEAGGFGELSMTAGGVASMFAAATGAGQTDLLSQYLPFESPAELEKALGWLAIGSRAVAIPNRGTDIVGFDLFAVARAGLASGYKYFGSHDWYRTLAERQVIHQRPDGAWGPAGSDDAGVFLDSAFRVAFLSIGRHPVYANKLKFGLGSAWNTRQRDLAHAARHAAVAAERPLNWSVVDFDRAGVDWLDAPVLYVAAADAPRFGERDYARLREYVQSGGMIYLHADRSSSAVNRFAPEFCKRLAPDYPLVDLPPDHPIYSVWQNPTPQKVRLRGASNGSRLLVLVSVTDVAGAWQGRATRAEPDAFKLAVNLYGYANGRAQPRYRLQTSDIPPVPQKPTTLIPVARLRHGGNWDPEPGAWPRAGRFLQWETGANVDVKPVPLAELKPATARVAHLTGTGEFAPTADELAALRQFVEAGGVLLVDACGGDATFRKSAETALAAAFPGTTLLAASPATAPFRAPRFGVMDDLTGPAELRPFVVHGAAGGRAGLALKVASVGKGFVVYSPLDLSTGLAGSNAWGVDGYTPDYGVGLVKNLLVWAATREQ